ncbi:RhoGAP domain protein [Cooperia oncophora]
MSAARPFFNQPTRKMRSSSWTDASPAEFPPLGVGYNIAHGLRSFHKGSAFLPAFVVEGCHAQLDDIGFDFVQQCIAFLEERGIREQGLYRNCGVTSKVQKLMQLGLDKRKANGDKLNFNDDEWEIKTISSAVKTFLRNLPEPLMTFEQHNLFINAAKMDDRRTRVDHIHYYVHKLPPAHKSIVADRCGENLMTVGNLGVCFGPTLLRPKEETMAAIMDIKFCNVVVEVLIANCEQIFGTEPPKSIGQPCPPKPDHRSIQQESSHPVISLSCSFIVEAFANLRCSKLIGNHSNDTAISIQPALRLPVPRQQQQFRHHHELPLIVKARIR